MTWECHVYDSSKRIYDIILGINILTDLGLYSEFHKHIIMGGDGPFEGCMVPMVELGMYDFNHLDIYAIVPEEYFTDSYVGELFGP